MSRIYPARNTSSDSDSINEIDLDDISPRVLTVWKRSSMSFQGTHGFTVFNGEGKLVFRVDNYSKKSRCLMGGIVLMDGAGKAILTLKPQILSMQYQWKGYKGDATSKRSWRSNTPLFSMRRKSMLQRNNNEAEVFMGGSKNHEGSSLADYRIEGSFRRRSCSIIGPRGEVVAVISRKKVVNTTVLLNDDVFSLVVQPGFDSELIMAFVIIMDRICPKPWLAPIMCS
ncbi:hypothetical protein AQUCO_00400551v1 [Aquilegia coerulea]|uniref:Tubby C-terminal domain-containing protein n=1 Tax=Aquilegia coerulea TaxID=218851 RepID=A0A2G5EVE2_AQUCA|nr:hypothetical protein AQUCO_00400551v1 [Aquilegia coerulea]